MSASHLREIFLTVGEYYFGSGPVRVRTVLGSCVAIAMWHPQRRLGGICHYLLPQRGLALERALGGFRSLYADDAMQCFAESLSVSQTQPGEYVVKIFGGGNMFPGRSLGAGCNVKPCTQIAELSCRNIGCQNVRTARRLLAAGGYSVGRQDVGGHGSRVLSFDLRDGTESVKRGAAMPATAI